MTDRESHGEGSGEEGTRGDEKSRPVRGLVLAGGGARGAYEAGVLAYIFQELPEKLLAASPIRVLCGTSVGAIHACYLAGTAHLPRHDIGRLVDLWRALRIEKMLRLRPGDLVRLPTELRALFTPSDRADGLLINSRLLRNLVARNTAWEHIGHNLEAGHIDALTVSCTHVATGKTVVFVDRKGGGAPSWTRDPRVVAKAARIGAPHALASASIPILFPPVKIDGVFYSDGGLRQNTPLSPALRLGADRVLVIGLRHEDTPDEPPPGVRADPEVDEQYPGAFYLLGKVADAIMLDRIEYDLARLEGFNMLLEEGVQTFGPNFVEEIGQTAERMRGARYRQIESVVIRPSRDIGEMANEFVDVFRSHLGRVSGWVFSKIAAMDVLGESDLLSYMLFDGRIAAALIELGRADADASRSKLIEFFRD